MLVHNWNKKNLDETFIIGTPEHRHEQFWIKNVNLRQAFSKKKIAAIDIVDKICQIDNHTREHVASNLDTLMNENKSSVTKMWNNYRRTGSLTSFALNE